MQALAARFISAGSGFSQNATEYLDKIVEGDGNTLIHHRCVIGGSGPEQHLAKAALHGATDEYGHEAVEGKVHTHDLHATILHLLGLDHERLTYRHGGRDHRLTDVKGTVVKPVLA